MVEVKESKKDKFTRFKNRICLAQKRRKDQKPNWDRSVDAYHGKILSPEKSDFSDFLTSVNLWYVDVRSTVPKLYSRNPYAFVDPITPEADLAAEVIEKVVNAKLDDWKLKQRMRSLVQGCKMKGRAYLKTSYRFEKDKIAREFYGEERNDDCIIHFVSREKLLLDPGCTSFETRRWAGHEICMPIEEIKAKWKIKDDEQISMVEDNDLPEEIPQDQRDDFKFGRVIEVEDLHDKTLSVIVDGIDRFVESPEPHPYGFSMYDALEWNDIPEIQDTLSDLDFWYKMLLELAESKTQQINHRRKLNSKYIWKGTNKPTDEQIKQLETYKDASYIVLKSGQSVEPMIHAPLGAEIYSTEQGTRQDISIISAMNEMRQGLSQVKKTAREAMAIYSESQDVMSERASRVDDVAASVITKCIKLIQENYDTTRVVALTGMEDTEFLGFKEKTNAAKMGAEVKGTAGRPFMAFVGTKLKGDMKVRIKVGSSRPVDEAQRKEETLAALEAMKTSPQMAARLDWDEVVKEVGKLLHLDTKKILLKPKNANQENALLKQDIPVMPALNEPHRQHIEDHMREDNGTDAFANHIQGHEILEKFLAQHQPTASAPVPNLGGRLPGGLSQVNIPGVAMGAAMPPPVVVPPPQGPSPMAPQQPPVQGIA